MSARRCCRGAARAGQRRPKPLARSLELLKWLAPGALLALLPKCPACLAGFVALATGGVISLPAAGRLRTALALACAAALAALLATRGRRALARLAGWRRGARERA